MVVDDEPSVCDFVRDVAAPLGFEVSVAHNGSKFQELCRAFKPTALVLDLQMPGHDGVELLQCLAEHHSSAAVILMSGMDAKVLSTAQRLGREYGLTMMGVLQKPIMLDDLEHLLNLCARVPKESLITEQALHGALENRELRVFYQPAVDLMSGSNGGHHIAAEALLRWQHPQQGLLLPGSFLDAMHEAGLTRQMTDYVLQAAIEQMSGWVRTGITTRVAVNLDPSLIDDLEFPDRLLALLREFEVEPSSLVLEITERGVLEHVVETMNVLTRLRLKGIGLSIDDFGTGNSSLIQLHRMPFSELKIDRSFVEDLAVNKDSKVIVRALIDMAHNLGMIACAEGVESHECVKTLIELGCDRAQGFLFSAALSAGDLLQWYASWDPDITGYKPVSTRLTS